MNKKNILPNQGQPVVRITAGKLSPQLAELSEEALGEAGVGASASWSACAYDGAEPSASWSACAYGGAEPSASWSACAYE